MFALSNVYTPNNAVSMDCGNDLFIIGLSNGHIIRYDSTVEGSTPEDLEGMDFRRVSLRYLRVCDSYLPSFVCLFPVTNQTHHVHLLPSCCFLLRPTA